MIPFVHVLECLASCQCMQSESSQLQNPIGSQFNKFKEKHAPCKGIPQEALQGLDERHPQTARVHWPAKASQQHNEYNTIHEYEYACEPTTSTGHRRGKGDYFPRRQRHAADLQANRIHSNIRSSHKEHTKPVQGLPISILHEYVAA